MSTRRLSTFAATIPLSLCAATLLMFAACSSDSQSDEDVDASTSSASGAEEKDGSTSAALDARASTTSPGQTTTGGNTTGGNTTGGNTTGGSPDGAVASADAGGGTPIVTMDGGLRTSDAGSETASDAGRGKLCGTRGAQQGCGPMQFCSFAESAQCGAADQGGMCKPRPQVCEQTCTPAGFCGCDGRAYCNECLAERAGTSIAKVGACETTPPTTTGKTCGGIANLQCDKGLFCDYEASAGGQGCGGTIADAAGKCQPVPANCPSTVRNPRGPAAPQVPVCGCDSKTYASACEAHVKGVSVKAQGACK